MLHNVDGLMQKRLNSITNALELHLFCIEPLMFEYQIILDIAQYTVYSYSQHYGTIIFPNAYDRWTLAHLWRWDIKTLDVLCKMMI